MALTPGTRLGPYEILAPIASGGMGDVYRARDTKLHREVAVKVVSDHLASDPARIARFEREAHVLASLNHPHIAQIHGFEESAGVRAFVMELVEGPTLMDRIASGPIPLDEALTLARQLAEALEAAHDRGVIHRDLKPANIKLTVNGAVKVLDFGLAKALDPAGDAEADATSSPMVTASATSVGLILGTAAYMAPEQAQGRAVDKRADIWAFGVVLYEMLTGRRLFGGESISDTLTAVLTKEPDLEQTPPEARHLLRRCLERDPRRRLRDIGDAMFLIEVAPRAAPVARNRYLPWMLTAATGLGLAAALLMLRPQPIDRPLMRLDVDLGSDAIPETLTVPAISPDGARLVFPIRNADGRQILATRLLAEARVTKLAGTEGGDQPFFSPDGQSIGFVADGKLKITSVGGGTPVSICNVQNPRGAVWTDDGSIVAALINTSGLWRVPPDRGPPQPLTRLEEGEPTHRWPQMLPGNKAVLFTARSTSLNSYEDASIDVLSLDTGVRKTLWRGGYFGRFLSSGGPRGHLVYVHRGVLYGVELDSSRLTIEGTPVPLLEDIASDPGSASGRFNFSRNGTFLYRTGVGTRSWPVSWLDSSGAIQPLLSKPSLYYSPRFSPDGKRLAIGIDDGKGSDIFVYDLQNDALSRLTFTAQNNADPVWTPGGKHVVYRSRSGDNWIMWWLRADGAGEPQRLLDKDSKIEDMGANSFSPDGRRLIFADVNATTRGDLWTLPFDLSDPDHPKPGAAEPFLLTPFDEKRPAFSPDGRWVAYESNDSGTAEIYVRSFPGPPKSPGGKWQISQGGGLVPIWSRKGQALFFKRFDDRIVVANYTTTSDSFVASKPRLWSERQLLNVGFTNLDLSPDGTRFAIFPLPQPAAPERGGHVTFLLNFLDGLRRRQSAAGLPAPVR